jgi:hypothetical protein
MLPVPKKELVVYTNLIPPFSKILLTTPFTVRAKDTSELPKLAITLPTNHIFRFLAREEAYVDNHSCHGRVVLRRNMTLTERDEAQAAIEATELSAIVGGKRDCQKWCVECIEAMGFSVEMVRSWEGLLGRNVWEIEAAVRGLDGKWGLEFLRSLSYREREVAEIESKAEKERGDE